MFTPGEQISPLSLCSVWKLVHELVSLQTQRTRDGNLLPPRIQSYQIVQTKRTWSSDELRNGSNNKEMIILK